MSCARPYLIDYEVNPRESVQGSTQASIAWTDGVMATNWVGESCCIRYPLLCFVSRGSVKLGRVLRTSQ